MNSTEARIKKSWDIVQAFSGVSSRGSGLALFRVFFGLYALFFGIEDWGWLGIIPDALFNPDDLNYVGLFNSFPSKTLLIGSDTLIVVCFAAITLGIRTRFFSMIGFWLVLLLNGFLFSLGKIDHGILGNLLMLVFAFSNAGVKLALVPDKEVSLKIERRAFGLYAIAIAFAMFTAGFPKALMWIDLDTSTSGVLRWYYAGFYTLERNQLLAPYFRYIPLEVLEILDYFVSIFEASGFFFLMKSRKHWRLWLFLLCGFHFINTLVLNIPFTVHIFVYGVFLLPLVFDKIDVGHRFIYVILPLVLILSANQFTGRWFYERASFFIIDQLLIVDLISWGVMLLMCVPYMVKSFLSTRKKV